MKKILIKNSIFGVIQIAINLVLIFIALPIFIQKLGIENYGIYSLISIIGNLNIFLNLGLTSALVRFIAAQGKSKESNIDIFVNVIIQGIGISILTVILLGFNNIILIKILKIPAEKLNNDIISLYFWVVLANFILFIGQTFKAILDALQKIYITSIQQIVYNIIYWGIIILVVYLDLGLTSVGFAIFLSALIWFLLTIVSAFKEWGEFSIRGFRRYFLSSIRKQLGYSLKIYTSGIIGFFYEPFSKLLVSHFIGIKEVGFLDIAFRIKNYIWGFMSKIFYPLFPFISQHSDLSIVRKFVHDIEQKTFYLIIPIVVTIILIIDPFITIWIHNHMYYVAMSIGAIIISHLIFSSTVIPNYQFLMVKGHEKKTILLQLNNVLVNALVFFVCVKTFGYYAIIISNVVAIMSSFFLSLYYQKKYLNSLIFDSVSQVINLIIIFLIIISVGIVSKRLLKGQELLIILIIPLLVISLTLLLFKIFHIINEEDIYRYFGKNNKLSNLLAKFYNNNKSILLEWKR